MDKRRKCVACHLVASLVFLALASCSESTTNTPPPNNQFAISDKQAQGYEPAEKAFEPFDASLVELFPVSDLETNLLNC